MFDYKKHQSDQKALRDRWQRCVNFATERGYNAVLTELLESGPEAEVNYEEIMRDTPPPIHDVTAQLKRNLIDTGNGNFEAHPESYHPRLFVELKEPLPSGRYCLELLRDGQAVTWPNAPSPRAGFDFWIIQAKNIASATMKRAVSGATVSVHFDHIPHTNC